MKSFLLLIGAVALTAGCSTSRFSASYVLDPKPPRVTSGDLKPVANPQPVSLVFDMHTAQGPFPEGTRKHGPEIASIIEDSRLFSSVARVGSENIARLQITLTEMAAATGSDIRSLPPALTSSLAGAEAALIFQFNASYQPAGKEPVRKVYQHAIHVLSSDGWKLRKELPMTAGQATGAMLEQLTLSFLRDLQREGKL